VATRSRFRRVVKWAVLFVFVVIVAGQTATYWWHVEYVTSGGAIFAADSGNLTAKWQVTEGMRADWQRPQPLAGWFVTEVPSMKVGSFTIVLPPGHEFWWPVRSFLWLPRIHSDGPRATGRMLLSSPGGGIDEVGTAWETRRDVVVPAWYLAVMALVATIVLFWRDRKWRYGPGHCRRCGYDLNKNESGRCPECGATCERVEKNAERVGQKDSERSAAPLGRSDS